MPCEYKKSPTHSRSFLRALQRRGSTGGRSRDSRSDVADLWRFCSDVAASAATCEVSDVMVELNRDERRVLIVLFDKRVTTAEIHQQESVVENISIP